MSNGRNRLSEKWGEGAIDMIVRDAQESLRWSLRLFTVAACFVLGSLVLSEFQVALSCLSAVFLAAGVVSYVEASNGNYAAHTMDYVEWRLTKAEEALFTQMFTDERWRR
jgi:hypothetical protein